jgi:hypothetical protein
MQQVADGFLFECLGKFPTLRETSRCIHKFKTSLGAELSLYTERVSGLSAVSAVSAASGRNPLLLLTRRPGASADA